MSYEQAPSTKMLFQHCLVCGRPLRDAISVEFGIGPTCRERCGLDDSDQSPNRPVVNKLIHQACDLVLAGNTTDLPSLIQQIRDLGYDKTADIVSKRFIQIRIEEAPAPSMPDVLEFRVHVPFLDGFGNCIRKSCTKVFWDRANKVYRLPVNPTNRVGLFRCLLANFPGQAGYGKKGVFTLVQALPDTH